MCKETQDSMLSFGFWGCFVLCLSIWVAMEFFCEWQHFHTIYRRYEVGSLRLTSVLGHQIDQSSVMAIPRRVWSPLDWPVAIWHYRYGSGLPTLLKQV